MMPALVLVLAAAVAVVFWYRERARRRVTLRLQRLLEGPVAQQPSALRQSQPVAFPPRYRTPAVAAAAGAGGALWYAGTPWPIAMAAALLAGVLAWLGESALASQRELRIEVQLVEAIDMLIGSLRAGASLLAALESSLADMRTPLRPHLEEMAGRIRLGDDPKAVLAALPERVPLETFRLFASAIAVHWEVGGSLATTLATVARTIRDRIELSRRVRAQGVEAHVSVGVVMVISYVLGFLMWRTNPDRLVAFLRTEIGSDLVAGAIVLQAIGLIWMAQMSRSQF